MLRKRMNADRYCAFTHPFPPNSPMRSRLERSIPQHSCKMAAKESFSIDGCVQKVLGKLKKFGINKLSVCQSKALRFFLSGYDTFAVLPTGHGKSLIYQMAALISKEKQADPVIFVVSPLNALIRDQIKECEKLELTCAKLEAGNIESFRKDCKCDVIFASTEVMEIHSARLLMEELGTRVIGIVVDESHCVVKW